MAIDGTEYIRYMVGQMYMNQQAANPYLKTAHIPAVQQESIDFQAGRLLWSPIRNSVGILKQKGWSISLWEGEGWLSRPFILKGEKGAVDQMVEWLNGLEND